MSDVASTVLAINRQRLGLATVSPRADDATFSTDNGADRRLCVYGRMRPGGTDHHILQQLDGDWEACQMNGVLQDPTACIVSGECPGLIWNPSAERQDGFLLTAFKLADKWMELDRHEDDDYIRLLTQVDTDAGPRVANVYAAAAATRAQVLLLDGYNVHDDVD